MCYDVLYPRYVYKSGETYDGDWVRGRRQGLGMFVHSSGDVYEGEFQQDKEYGEGVLEFRNGDLYEGGN
ncbi:hypothetical protein B484DRAFT_329335 [Ochromonadaceae sp. CCMP2298]|nr:hypothetical protein B484DRAFT_329335 [Ochromonadaceae sp. CCMP2298]